MIAPEAEVPPRPIGTAAGNAKPEYPAEARQRGWQGRVLLRVEVSAAGEPLTVDVRVSSGHSVLDQAALHAVEAWRFVPAMRGGAAVAGSVDVPIRFRLED
jgi:protein TonB